MRAESLPTYVFFAWRAKKKLRISSCLTAAVLVESVNSSEVLRKNVELIKHFIVHYPQGIFCWDSVRCSP